MIPSGDLEPGKKCCARADRSRSAIVRQIERGRAEAGRAFNVSLKGGQGLPSSRLERLCWGAVGSAFTRFLMHGRNQSKNRKYLRVSSWQQTRAWFQTRRSIGSSPCLASHNETKSHVSLISGVASSHWNNAVGGTGFSPAMRAGTPAAPFRSLQSLARDRMHAATDVVAL